eukprot:UN5172
MTAALILNYAATLPSTTASTNSPCSTPCKSLRLTLSMRSPWSSRWRIRPFPSPAWVPMPATRCSTTFLAPGTPATTCQATRASRSTALASLRGGSSTFTSWSAAPPPAMSRLTHCTRTTWRCSLVRGSRLNSLALAERPLCIWWLLILHACSGHFWVNAQCNDFEVLTTCTASYGVSSGDRGTYGTAKPAWLRGFASAPSQVTHKT